MRFNYTYDETTGITTCEIRKKYGKRYVGTATCHEDDKSYQNEHTGRNIAEKRAFLVELTELIKTLDAEIKIITNLYKEISCGKAFNADSYEAKKMRTKIEEMMQDKNDAIMIREKCKEELKNYINEKNKIYRFTDQYRQSH